MQFIVKKGHTKQYVHSDTVKDWKQLGYTVCALLEYELSDEDIDALEAGASLSISEVTLLTMPDYPQRQSVAPVAVINNAAAAKEFPNLASQAVSLALAAVATGSDAVTYSYAPEDTVNQIMTAQANTASLQTLGIQQEDTTSMEALGTTTVVSTDPLILRRSVPFKEVYNAVNQHQDA